MQNIRTSWDRYTPYDGIDDTAEERWKAISIDHGIIALSDEYVHTMGLSEARRFPWDHGKGLYVIQSYHDLHCLVKLNLST